MLRCPPKTKEVSVDSQNWKGRWQNRARCVGESGKTISGDIMGPCCRQKPCRSPCSLAEADSKGKGL